jgi:hypothetical protein
MSEFVSLVSQFDIQWYRFAQFLVRGIGEQDYKRHMDAMARLKTGIYEDIPTRTGPGCFYHPTLLQIDLMEMEQHEQ